MLLRTLHFHPQLLSRLDHVKNTFLDKLLNRLDRVGQADLQAYLQRLSKEKGFFETIFNTLQEGIVVVDARAHPVSQPRHHHAARHRSRPRRMGSSMAQHLKELDWPKILAEGRVVNRDLEVFYPQQRYLNFYLVPLEDNEAELMGFAIIFHDQTARREQAREALESERLNAVTLLAAGVAHELGNPLNSLNIHLQLLERDLRKRGDGRREATRTCSTRCAWRAAKWRGSTPSSTSSSARCARPTPPAPWSASTRSCANRSLSSSPRSQDRDVIVQEELAEGLPPIPANPDQLKQAFYNLIKNAVQALSHGGILRVTTSRSDTQLQISFEDNGTGISIEDMAHITEPYFTRKKTGTGLGLFIVQRILHEHGGHLELLSQPGRGTTARILLPLAERRVRLLGGGDDAETSPHETRPAVSRAARTTCPSSSWSRTRRTRATACAATSRASSTSISRPTSPPR